MSVPDPTPLPLTALVVNGVRIPAEMIEQGSMFHDIDTGTLSLTFANVRHVETQYKHMEAFS